MRSWHSKALAWGKIAPIGQRVLKSDAQLEEVILKKNLDSMEFVYVEECQDEARSGPQHSAERWRRGVGD